MPPRIDNKDKYISDSTGKRNPTTDLGVQYATLIPQLGLTVEVTPTPRLIFASQATEQALKNLSSDGNARAVLLNDQTS